MQTLYPEYSSRTKTITKKKKKNWEGNDTPIYIFAVSKYMLFAHLLLSFIAYFFHQIKELQQIPQ